MSHDGPRFTRNAHGQVVGVDCSCGWSASGTGGTSAHGQAWGMHASEELRVLASGVPVKDQEGSEERGYPIAQNPQQEWWLDAIDPDRRCP